MTLLKRGGRIADEEMVSSGGNSASVCYNILMIQRKPNKVTCRGQVCYLKMYRGKDNTWHTTKFDKADLELVKAHCWSVMREGTKRIVPYNFTQKRMHTFLMGKKPGLVIDHINRKPLDNRRCNLRHVTCQQNLWNRKDSRNIYYAKDRKKWRVEVWQGGKQKSLGSYPTKKEAITVRFKWEATHQPNKFGDRRNKPVEN